MGKKGWQNRIFREKLCRSLLAAVVLFYVLWPQTGFCACPDCHCKNSVPATPFEEESLGEEPCCSHCCCSQAKKAETTERASLSIYVPKVACCAGEDRADDPAKPCRCSCSETKMAPPTPQRTTVQTLEFWQDLKDSSHSVFAILPETQSALPWEGTVYHRINPLARLPVRLHLLFAVLLN